MNLKKIGAYIASKRKSLGMTQAELAKKLGMSDKSVSKWERGICLPDVSVYIQLCEILGISLNEFIAGEDLKEEQIAKQAEENIIVVAEEGDRKRKKLIRILIALSLIYLMIAYIMMIQTNVRYRNYIEPLPEYSSEKHLMESVFADDNVFMYKYDLNNTFKCISVYLTKYQEGKIIEKQLLLSHSLKSSRTEGMVAVLEKNADNDVKVIITDDKGNSSSETSVSLKAEGEEQLIRSISELKLSTAVKNGDEVALTCFAYSGGERVSLPVEDILKGNGGMECDYIYLISAKFGNGF